MTVIEFPRRKNMAGLMLGIGLFIGLVGTFAVPGAQLGFRIGFAAFGFLIAALTLEPLFSRTPRFRANHKGVWFGGGDVIRWSAIKYVYKPPDEPKGYATATAIAFEFHKRTTLFKAPISHWFLAIGTFGVVHVAPPDRAASDLVEQLRKLRRENSAA
jgi:hypothetical protein